MKKEENESKLNQEKEFVKLSALIQATAISEAQGHLVLLKHVGVHLRYPIKYKSSRGLIVIANSPSELRCLKTEITLKNKDKINLETPNTIHFQNTLDEDNNLIDSLTKKIIVPFTNIEESDSFFKKIIKKMLNKR